MKIIFKFAGQFFAYMDLDPGIFENTEVAFAGKTNGELRKAKLLFQLVGSNVLVKVGSWLAQLALNLHLPVSPLFRWTIYDHFCGGETFEECKKTIQALEQRKVGVLLNYGVELKETEVDFDKTIARNVEALEFGGKNKAVKGLCIKLTGFGRFGLFEKIEAGKELTAAEKEEFARVKVRFTNLCEVAAKNEVPLYVDAEETWIQNTLDAMVEEMMAKYNRGKCVVFQTVQLYRNDKLQYVHEQIAKGKTGGYMPGLKLVRGAYMEKERARAAEMNYPSPIHNTKPEVDKDYDEALNTCLNELQHVFVCVASQSEESNLLAMKLINEKGIDTHHPHLIFSQLYGMGDNITFNMAEAGMNATKYLPYGPVYDVIPYLIRRAQENTSVAGQTGRELALLQKEIRRRGN